MHFSLAFTLATNRVRGSLIQCCCKKTKINLCEIFPISPNVCCISKHQSCFYFLRLWKAFFVLQNPFVQIIYFSFSKINFFPGNRWRASERYNNRSPQMVCLCVCLSRVTSKMLPNVYKSCPKMISQDFDTITKIAKECWRFGQVKCCQRLWKVAQSPINHQIWSHWC